MCENLKLKYQMKNIGDFKLTDSVTVGETKQWIQIKDDESKQKLVNLIYHRFYNRYIKHVKMTGSGFLKMSIACLVIETLESFKQGVEDTTGKSKRMFIDFFASEQENFPGFNEISKEFYEDVRCGILHQGETTNAWRILKVNELLDVTEKTINAIKFVEALEKALEAYINKLKDSDFEEDIWTNAFTKLEDIIKNCEEHK